VQQLDLSNNRLSDNEKKRLKQIFGE